MKYYFSLLIGLSLPSCADFGFEETSNKSYNKGYVDGRAAAAKERYFDENIPHPGAALLPLGGVQPAAVLPDFISPDGVIIETQPNLPSTN